MPQRIKADIKIQLIKTVAYPLKTKPLQTVLIKSVARRGIFFVVSFFK